MKIINPSHEILDKLNGEEILRKIELCGRVCYKSEDKITYGSAKRLVTQLIKSGHESVLEHFSFSVRFITDRGISHEIVRHRLASYSQESTRYCNYGGKDIEFVIPQSEIESEKAEDWFNACLSAEEYYNTMISSGVSPQIARSVLPNSLKTEIIMTANLREWRHFFKLRTAKAAHPDMRALTIPLLEELKQIIPVIFDDIEVI